MPVQGDDLRAGGISDLSKKFGMGGVYFRSARQGARAQFFGEQLSSVGVHPSPVRLRIFPRGPHIVAPNLSFLSAKSLQERPAGVQTGLFSSAPTPGLQ